MMTGMRKKVMTFKRTHDNLLILNSQYNTTLSYAYDFMVTVSTNPVIYIKKLEKIFVTKYKLHIMHK